MCGTAVANNPSRRTPVYDGRMVMASIARLGFDLKDVKVLLNSEPHADHGDGLAVLQQASGAELWASGASADASISGGDDPDRVLP